MRTRRSFTVAMTVAAACLVASCTQDDPEEKLPSEPVEVLVDDMGVAHLYARSDRDAMWAAGYREASDRLYQMEMLRRFAQGRLAEVLGEPGAARDRLVRAFDLVRWGRADAEATRAADPERADLLHAWVMGINARIDEIRSGAVPRPFGYRPSERDFLPERWTDEDPYVVLKGAGLALDKTIEFEIALTLLERLYPAAMQSVDVLAPARAVFSVLPEDRPAAAGAPRTASAKHASTTSGPAAAGASRAASTSFASLSRMLDAMPRASGSNNWAVAGRFTDTGRPLIAGDPHLAFDFFGAPYPLHISSKGGGGTFDVAGFAYPGTPGIALGHNDRVIWTATSAFADVTDVYEVKRSGDDAVIIGGAPVLVKTRKEKILVRDDGVPAGEGHVEEIDYEDVPGHGVLLPGDILPIPIGGPFLVRWTGFVGRPARWFMELDRVSSLDDFEQAVDRMREMNYNFVAADATGIAYRVGVDVPQRAPVTATRRPWAVQSGDDPEGPWRPGMLDRANLPRGRAAQRGFLATANNDPLGFSQPPGPAAAPYYYGAFFDPGYRAARITDELTRLTTKGGVTADDMKTLQMDTVSTLAAELAAALRMAHAKVATDPALAEAKGDVALDRLVVFLGTEWDRRMARDSKGALAYQALLHFLAAEVLKDDIALGYDFALKLQAVFVAKIAAEAVLGHYPNGDRIVQGGRDLVLLRAAKKAAAWLVLRHGAVDAAPYSARKVVSFDHALGYGVALSSVPTDGGEDTICVSQNISFSESDAPWVSSYVSVERTVGTFGADGVPEAFVQFPFAGPADPDAPDTKAATAAWVDGRYRKLPFRKGEVESRTVRRETYPARR